MNYGFEDPQEGFKLILQRVFPRNSTKVRE